MCNYRKSQWSIAAGMVAVAMLSARSFAVVDLDRVRAQLDEGKVEPAIASLVSEVADNPAHESARMLLAEAYEKAGRLDEAVVTWKELMQLSRNEANVRTARRALNRLRRILLDRRDTADGASKVERTDPFKIPMPEVDWTGLEQVEDTKYLPPILPPPYAFEVPPFAYETKHFTVYSTNERLSKVIGDRAEIYLDFMIERLFAGRSWALRFPILVYQSYDDYVQHGAPAGTGGVTMGHVTGKTQAILLFQHKPDFYAAARGGKAGGSGNEVWKYGIESVLPHELTHAVINEFFAGRPIPRWLHEAVAGRFEQTRDHYTEAARLARKVAAGEYFRMRDLFDQKGYPERIALFYEQAAIVVLYLFETGPEAMHAFFNELAAGNGHDAACAAALGIPEDGAVEEFERRWVEWMKKRYVTDLDLSADDTQVVDAAKSDNAALRPWVNEVDTVDTIKKWRSVAVDSLDAFLGVGGSEEEWSVEAGKLRSNTGGDRGSSVLGIRMNETAPVAVRATVRCLSNPGSEGRWFGFAQLDAEGHDTRVEVLAPLSDNNEHKIVCIWSDDLAIYLDGTCVGRYPAFHITGNARDIDFPLALVALGPVEVMDLSVAPITNFSDKPVVAQADTAAPSSRDNRATRRERRGRRSPP